MGHFNKILVQKIGITEANRDDFSATSAHGPSPDSDGHMEIKRFHVVVISTE
jgi:hypothetical protein